MIDLDRLEALKKYIWAKILNETIPPHEWFEWAEAIDNAMKRYNPIRYVRVVRCENCVDWEAPPENERLDGSTTGHCRCKYGACYGEETDATWFCADGERVEE